MNQFPKDFKADKTETQPCFNCEEVKNILEFINIKIPKKLDQILSYIIVTPNMHKIHHHYELPYTDSNYGNIFSIWDRFFKTFSNIGNQKSVIYGIDTYMD